MLLILLLQLLLLAVAFYVRVLLSLWSCKARERV
jgi:hypothetical protein